MKIRDIALARSGDKGNRATLSVIAYDPADYARLERVLRPRAGLLVTSDLAERVIGLIAFPLALILFLPIPFGNILPAASIAALALGLAERDGIAVALGYLFSLASVALLAAVSSALYVAVLAFFHALFGA